MSTENLGSLSAEELRLKGNEAFKEKLFHNAIGFYSESLAKNLDPIVLSNRSQSFLKIGYYEAAMSDASESIKLNPTPKAYYRRATAMHHLGFHSKAREDLRIVVKMEPKNREAVDFLDKILITHDRPIIPLRLLEKKPYVQSKKPMKQIPIEDLMSGLDINDTGSSLSPVDSGVSSTTETFFNQLEEEPLPLPAQNSMDLVVALSTLKFHPKKLVEYFLTLDLSNFDSIFSAGVEPDFLETLLSGVLDAPKTKDFLEKLLKLATCNSFGTSLMFTPEELKNDLKTYLSQITECDSLAKRVSEVKMYNGIGLSTARGSGTNGYVQANLSSLLFSKQKIDYNAEADMEKNEAELNKGPNKDLLLHEYKRRIEIKCAEFEDLMEEKGFSEKEILDKVNEYRKLLFAEFEAGKMQLEHELDDRNSHSRAHLAQVGRDRFRNALKIDEKYKPGSSFEQMKKPGEEAKTENKEEAEKEEKEAAEKKAKIDRLMEEIKKEEEKAKLKAKKKKKSKKSKKHSDSSSSSKCRCRFLSKLNQKVFGKNPLVKKSAKIVEKTVRKMNVEVIEKKMMNDAKEDGKEKKTMNDVKEDGKEKAETKDVKNGERTRKMTGKKEGTRKMTGKEEETRKMTGKEEEMRKMTGMPLKEEEIWIGKIEEERRKKKSVVGGIMNT
ncbi:hypothetical protein FO519_008042 [Halicephalobus sp. NKZ332]|nr:hypothetical protein FO519_008042 [Halicephalobus sp. NKZ332]